MSSHLHSLSLCRLLSSLQRPYACAAYVVRSKLVDNWRGTLTRILTLVMLTACCRSSSAQLELPSPSDTLEAAEAVVGNGAIALDNASLVELDDGEVIPEVDVTPNWWSPTVWLWGPTWDKGLELGINGSEGNAQAFSILTSGHLKRKTDCSSWGIDIVYGKSQANSILTQHYAFLNSRYDYELGEGRWSLFSISRLEYDEFKAFDLRWAANGGLGYDIIQTETRKLTGRFGAGTSREFGGPDSDWVPEAVYGADYHHELSKKQKISLTTDYYPAWDDFADYRLVTQASWELLLDEASNLSLKIGLLDRYDSTPQGRQPNDVDYFITLLWKM